MIITHSPISIRTAGHRAGLGSGWAPVSRRTAVALGDLATHRLEIVQDAVARYVFVCKNKRRKITLEIKDLFWNADGNALQWSPHQLKQHKLTIKKTNFLVTIDFLRTGGDLLALFIMGVAPLQHAL